MEYRTFLKAVGRASMELCEPSVTETYCDYFCDDGASRVLATYSFLEEGNINKAFHDLAKQDMEEYACLMMDLWCRLDFEGEAYL